MSNQDSKADEDDVDVAELPNVDMEYLRMSRFIMDKRDEFNRFQISRQENSNDQRQTIITPITSNKYNINIDISKTTTTKEGNKTFCDLLFNFMENDGNKIQIDKIRKFIIDNEYESDSIKEDFDFNIYFGDPQSQSNLYTEFNDNDAFGSMTRFMNKYKS